MPMLTAGSGTVAQVTDVLQAMLADGRTDYVILQLPTGDMTYAESRRHFGDVHREGRSRPGVAGRTDKGGRSAA